MEALARSFIVRAFGLTPNDPFPSYISVHIRHTDFAQMRKDNETKDCFAPLSAYSEKIDDNRAELLEHHGVSTVDNVLVASDELDPGLLLHSVAAGIPSYWIQWLYRLVKASWILYDRLYRSLPQSGWEDGFVRKVSWGPMNQ